MPPMFLCVWLAGMLVKVRRLRSKVETLLIEVKVKIGELSSKKWIGDLFILYVWFSKVTSQNHLLYLLNGRVSNAVNVSLWMVWQEYLLRRGDSGQRSKPYVLKFKGRIGKFPFQKWIGELFILSVVFTKFHLLNRWVSNAAYVSLWMVLAGIFVKAGRLRSRVQTLGI